MRTPSAVVIGIVAVGMAVSIWSVFQLVMTPVLTQTVGRARPLSPHRAAGPAAAAQPWHDPSVDPKVLEKAFPAPPPLPPEARPKPSSLMPSEKEWHRIQHQNDAVAY